jgi:hypothetical protein
MATIAHLLAFLALLSSLTRELRREKQTIWDNMAYYALTLLIWWAVFLLLLEVVK